MSWSRGGHSSSTSKPLTLDSFAPSATKIAQTPIPVQQPTKITSSSLEITNRFTPLGKPTQTQKPAQNTPTQTQIQPLEREPLQHKTKPLCKRLLLLEPEMGDPSVNVSGPWNIYSKYHTMEGSGWIPSYGSKKNLKFYQFILLDTKSADIVENYNEKDKTKVAYSQCKILKVFDPAVYDYFDYQAAWESFLDIPNDKHSWYFQILSNQSIYPSWFLDWFVNNGLSVEIFPNSIYSTYLEYKTLTPKIPAHEKLLKFCAQFGLSRLHRFSYDTHQHLPEPFPRWICSSVIVSWWRKFNEDFVLTKFETWKKHGLQKRRLPQSVSTPQNSPARDKGKNIVGTTSSVISQPPSPFSPYSISFDAASPAELKKKLLEAASTVGSDEVIEEPEFSADDLEEFNPYLENNDPDVGFVDF